MESLRDDGNDAISYLGANMGGRQNESAIAKATVNGRLRRPITTPAEATTYLQSPIT